MNKMCLIVPALLLALVMGTAGALPMQASDGNASVVLFGSIRMPYELNDSEEILKVDTGLMNASNATYQMVDQYDAVYDPVMYKPLNEGRQLVYFVVPKDSLFKMIIATPVGAKPMNINWWATPRASNEFLLIRYYGITDWLINPDEQGIVVQVRGQSNGTQDVTFSPENFVLLDQWGWPYSATAGFDTEVIAPGGASEDRVLVGFSGISLQSRPAALVYGYYTESPIVIDFDLDNLQLTNEQVYGTAGAENVSAAQPAGQALAVPVTSGATNESAVAGAPANNTTAQNATVASNINSSVSSTKARLAAARERLKQQTKDDGSEGSATPSSATPSSATPSSATPSNATPSNAAASSNNAPSSSPESTGIFSSEDDIM